MIHIDGSEGEGGGQVLRSSLALSIITGQAFTITNIRANRSTPGLRRQHMTCAKAAATICKADLRGVAVGSCELSFAPGAVKNGNYKFSVGTAGSTTLVLQTVLPPLLVAEGLSTVTVEGGTHNVGAPPYHFLANAFLPVLNRLGPKIEARLNRYGFVPAGGGSVTVSIDPGDRKLGKIDLCDRGDRKNVEVIGVVADLSTEIAKDETKRMVNSLKFQADKRTHETVESNGPGNVAMVVAEFEELTEVFTGFGARSKSRFQVASAATKEANAFWQSGAAVGTHLADQLLLPMAIAGGGRFVTMEPTRHTTTNIDIIKKFMDVEFNIEQINEMCWQIEASGSGKTGPATRDSRLAEMGPDLSDSPPNT